MTTLKTHVGVVTQLHKAKGYTDPVFTQADKTLAGTAAIGAAAMQEFFSSAMLSSSSMGADIDVEYFTCVVNGLPLAGHFHKVGFTEGEEVEFVIEEQNGGGIVHAARSPNQRILWMLPYQTRGHLAQKKSDWKWTWILSLISLFLVFLSETFFFDRDKNEPIIYQLWFYLGIFSVVFLINAAIRRRFTHFAKSATDVLGAFGYPNPEQVDLYKQHSLAQTKLKQETGQLPPSVDTWSFRY
jgi:hypothetical protein